MQLMSPSYAPVSWRNSWRCAQVCNNQNLKYCIHYSRNKQTNTIWRHTQVKRYDDEMLFATFLLHDIVIISETFLFYENISEW